MKRFIFNWVVLFLIVSVFLAVLSLLLEGLIRLQQSAGNGAAIVALVLLSSALIALLVTAQPTGEEK